MLLGEERAKIARNARNHCFRDPPGRARPAAGQFRRPVDRNLATLMDTLMDFARIIEVLDRNGVSFVSVKALITDFKSELEAAGVKAG